MPKSPDDETLREAQPEVRRDQGALRLHLMGRGTMKTMELPARGSLLIGRQPEAEILLDGPAVSRRHAYLHLGDLIRLEDLGSANGTRVGDQRLASGDTVLIAPGTPIEIGSWTLTLSAEQGSVREVKVWPRAYLAACLDQELVRARKDGTALSLIRVRAYGALPLEAAARLLGRDLGRDELLAEQEPGCYDLLLLGRSRELETELARAIVQRLAGEGLSDVSLQISRLGDHGADRAALLARLDGSARASADAESSAGLIVEDPAMLRLYQLVDRVASGSINVLLLGETGVGKEVTAQRLHQRSPRASGPFIKLNCAALPEALLESELFGYEKAAFTGADSAKPGLVEAADGGSLFLDEIGEISPAIQAKLLRVLEDRSVQRLGSLKPRTVDVRIVSATNRDLEAASAEGRFRSDLYYRLNGIALTIPPLRERSAEIVPLAQFYLSRAAKADGRSPLVISAEALALLQAHRWPGNVRELKNVMERALILCTGNVILPEHLPPQLASRATPAPPPSGVASLSEDMTAFERARIVAALEAAGGNQTKAAKLLGIARRTLINRLDEYGIQRPRKRNEPE